MKNLKKFLEQSNYIEDERSKIAYKDARKAWDYLMNQDELLKGNILLTHGILMYNLNLEIAGNFRDCDVRVGFKTCPSWEQVPDLVNKWIELHSKAKTEEEIKKAHVTFEGVHPFQDGNGRTGRIIMNWQRVKAGLPILVIEEAKKWEYYDWFRA